MQVTCCSGAHGIMGIFFKEKKKSYEEGTIVYDGQVGLNLEVLQRNATLFLILTIYDIAATLPILLPPLYPYSYEFSRYLFHPCVTHYALKRHLCIHSYTSTWAGFPYLF